MNYDLLTTICGVIVAVSGVIMMDTQADFSGQVHVIAKCVNIAATSLGFYFANKTNDKTKNVNITLPTSFDDVKKVIDELKS